jgi:hypothetical protein
MLDAMKRAPVAVAALIVALALVGCSTPTPSGGTDGGGGSGGTSGRPGVSDGGSDSGSDDGGGSDGGTTGDDSGVAPVAGRLPQGWPDSVVVPEGEIIQGMGMGGAGWLALIAVADPMAAYAESSASLQAAGYTVVSEADNGTQAVGIYENDEYQVQVAAAPSEESAWNMSYTITTKG